MSSRSASRDRLRHSVLAVIAALALMVFASTAAAATVGVNSDITWGITPAQVSEEVALTKQAGISWIRTSVDLSDAEPQAAGQLDTQYLAQIDSEIRVARNAGLNVLMEFDRAPYWASADPAKSTDASGSHWNHYWKYANVRDYASIVSALVSHYKTFGVHAFELWNEPNLSQFWPSGPNAAEYTQLLTAAYPAVKAADPTATVLMAGLSNKGSYAFLQGMYNAGARGAYDVANFHIYPEGDPSRCLTVGGRPYEGSFCLLQGLRALMTANGDSSPVWVTELGWSTCTSETPCFTEQQQASYITSSYQMLAGYSWVQTAFVYQMRDVYWDASNASWESSLGLLHRDFTPKPAYTAMQAVATGAAGAPAPAPAPKPKKHGLNVAAVSRLGLTPAHVSLGLRRTSRSSRRLLALARVSFGSSAASRRLIIVAERRVASRWVTRLRRSVRLAADGQYRGLLGLGAGSWRVRAACSGGSALRAIRLG